jgi:hypothetical protein
MISIEPRNGLLSAEVRKISLLVSVSLSLQYCPERLELLEFWPTEQSRPKIPRNQRGKSQVNRVPKRQLLPIGTQTVPHAA